jgi:double-strand break repair protein MRE11
MDNIKVEKLVHDFLTVQSLKILPQASFGDAVTQFVDKQDKYAMDTFVDENLTVQVKQLMLANADSDDDELEVNMDRIRTQQEELFKAGVLKRKSKSKKIKPRPQHWDSDEEVGVRAETLFIFWTVSLYSPKTMPSPESFS